MDATIISGNCKIFIEKGKVNSQEFILLCVQSALGEPQERFRVRRSGSGKPYVERIVRGLKSEMSDRQRETDEPLSGTMLDPECGTKGRVLRKLSIAVDFGQSYLKNETTQESAERVEVSLSHTEGLTVCAVCDAPIGIDAERVDRAVKWKEISERFFDGRAQTKQEFFRLWTAAEANAKRVGASVALWFGRGADAEFFTYENYLIALSRG